jgi:hypothetical protein
MGQQPKWSGLASKVRATYEELIAKYEEGLAQEGWSDELRAEWYQGLREARAKLQKLVDDVEGR